MGCTIIVLDLWKSLIFGNRSLEDLEQYVDQFECLSLELFLDSLAWVSLAPWLESFYKYLGKRQLETAMRR